ncbi:MAG TPA: hypothetical protein VFM18_19225 [Methanosarcina sp.]|nr:hypothetical protein [Methanosarcina sp.]
MSIYTNIYVQQIQSISTSNKYTNWYCTIVNRAQKRASTRKEAKDLYEYIEGHHILPKSFNLGGAKDKSNFVYLTAKEHFICHWLLCKMITHTPYKIKMQLALNAFTMSSSNQKRHKITSRQYESIKKQMASAKTGIKQSAETIAKRSAALKGKNTAPKSAEHKAAISKSKQGQGKGKISPRKGVPMTVESSIKKSMSMRGKNTAPKSEEYKLKRSAAYKGIVNLGPKTKVTCPFCKKLGGVNVMQRWHFNNCKEKQ